MARRNKGRVIPADSAIETLSDALDEAAAKVGISRINGTAWDVPESALNSLLSSAVRRTSVSLVPSTPRFLTKDIGGAAVSKGSVGTNAWRSRTFADLRRARDDGPLIPALHQAKITRIIGVAGHKWSGRIGDTGYRVVDMDHTDYRAKPPEYMTPYIKAAESLIEQPCTMPGFGCTTFGSYLGKFLDDLFTINRPVTEILHSTLDPDIIEGFRAVDGALIYETMDFIRNWMRDPKNAGTWRTSQNLAEAALEAISDATQLDWMGRPEWCLVRDGVPEALYTADQLIIEPMQTRTDVRWAGYPPGYLELALEAISAFWTTYDFDINRWSNGTWNDFFIYVTGGIQTSDLQAAMAQLRQRKGYRGAASVPVVRGSAGSKPEIVNFRPVTDDLAFQKRFSFYASLVCAVYREHPSIINFPSWDGGKAATLSDASEKTQIDYSRTDGIRHDTGIVSQAATRFVKRIHPRLRLLIELGDIDHQADTNIIDIKVKSWMTRNEARLAQGMYPLSSPGFPDWIAPEDYAKTAPEVLRAFKLDPYNMPASSPYDAQLKESLTLLAGFVKYEKGVELRAPWEPEAEQQESLEHSRQSSVPKQAGTPELLEKGPHDHSTCDDWLSYP